MQAEAPAHVVPDSAGGLRWRHAKTHWRSEAQSEYKQILFPFRTGQGLNTDLQPSEKSAACQCMTSLPPSLPSPPSLSHSLPPPPSLFLPPFLPPSLPPSLPPQALTGPKLTNSESRILRRASDGNRLDLMLPKRRVPAAASPDGAVEASPGRAAMASPSVGSESLQRRLKRLACADRHEINRGGGFQTIIE